MIEGKISGPEALVFFYAVFWALVFNAVARFKAFDTQLLFRHQNLLIVNSETLASWRALLRILAAVIVVNIAPFVWFMILYEYVIPHDYCYSSVVAAGVASLGLSRIPALSACDPSFGARPS